MHSILFAQSEPDKRIERNETKGKALFAVVGKKSKIKTWSRKERSDKQYEHFGVETVRGSNFKRRE